MPTNSVFTLSGGGAENANNGDYIAYCFANIDGYQRIGSYIGNGSNNGPFIYTGFEPAWVIIKNADTAYRWYILDNKRNTTNPRGSRLFADDDAAEVTNSNVVDFHTNGFSLLTSDAEANKNGDKILFMAIAANPDTTAPAKANSFKTKIYAGTGSTHAITGLGFKPDFIWTKNRETTDSSALVDSVRGIVSPAPYLASDLNSIQATSTNMPTSVQADGYTITGAGGRTNTGGEDYVSWNWKAADHDRNLAAINSSGSTQSIVSANSEAGFSIVKYTGNATAGATVGHGLSAKPEFILFKRLAGSATSWIAYDTINNVIGYLDNTDSLTDGRRSWAVNNTDPTSKVVTLGSNAATNANGSGLIMYCWHSASGHSKIGSYPGNGSTTGPSITVGFRPSWVLIKRISDTGSWYIFDAARAGSTTAFPKILYANLNNVEYDTTGTAYDGMVITTTATTFEVDFSSAWTNLNASGSTYLYMAFK